MKKSVIALGLAVLMCLSLTACMDRENTGKTTGSGSVTNGQVARRSRDGYMADGWYAADGNGRVYDGGADYAGRDLTQDARDIVRDVGDAIGDAGRAAGDLGRDLTGNNSGTPSWEPSASARY